MRIGLLFRKIYRLLKSGSARSKDYRNYIGYLQDASFAYPTAFFNLTVDFELAWSGKRGSTASEESLKRGRLARENLAPLLSLLDSYRIPATFALVGQIALDGPDRDYYGADLARAILTSGLHEIASHGFSHADLADKAVSAEAAEFEISESRRILEKLGSSLDTFVFPNNRPAFIDILAKNQFTIYRSNANKKLEKDRYGCWQFPLGIWASPNAFGPKDARRLVELAIRNKKIINFWCHLHEFQNKKILESFFEPLFGYIKERREKGLIAADTMRGIVQKLAK